MCGLKNGRRDFLGDSTKLLMAVLACLLGYGEVGLWLRKQVDKPGSKMRLEGNQYRTWIEDYSGEMYQNAVRVGLGRSCLLVRCWGLF